jgi:hypothetical protein
MLIFEDRAALAFMLMIRRELPRTGLAGRNRITDSRVLLSVAALDR